MKLALPVQASEAVPAWERGANTRGRTGTPDQQGSSQARGQRGARVLNSMGRCY